MEEKKLKELIQIKKPTNSEERDEMVRDILADRPKVTPDQVLAFRANLSTENEEGKVRILLEIIDNYEVTDEVQDILLEHKDLIVEIKRANLKEIKGVKAENDKLKEAINEVLEVFDGKGVPNTEWIKNRLSDALS